MHRPWEGLRSLAKFKMKRQRQAMAGKGRQAKAGRHAKAGRQRHARAKEE